MELKFVVNVDIGGKMKPMDAKDDELSRRLPKFVSLVDEIITEVKNELKQNKEISN